MSNSYNEHKRNVTRSFLYLILELGVGSFLMLLGVYYAQNLILGLGLALCIIAIILFVALNGKYDKELEKNG